MIHIHKIVQNFIVSTLVQTGMVDRHRVLHLFSLFYDSNPAEAQERLQNPKKCKLAQCYRYF